MKRHLLSSLHNAVVFLLLPVQAATAAMLPGKPVSLDLATTISSTTSSPATTGAVVRCTIDAGNQRIVPRELFGVNTLFFHERDSIRENPSYRASLKLLSPSVMRFPAGTAGDNYLWKTNSLVRADWYPRRSDPAGDADTTEFLKLAKEFDAMPLMVLNYRSFAAADDMESCYRNAEEWVTFVNREKKAGVRFWEFGNEVYFKNLGVDPEHYAASYQEMRRRLKRIDPELQLGLAMANFWNGGPALVERFNERVTAKLDAAPDFIILHSYPVVDADNFARNGMDLRNRIRGVRNGLQERGFDSKRPIFVTEWNASSKSDVLRGQTMGHLACVAQGLLELNDCDVQCATFWPMHDSDKGLMKKDTYELQPAALVMSWLRDVMSGSRRVGVKMEPPPGAVEAAGFLTPDGTTMRVVLVNRELDQECRLQLTLPTALGNAETTLTVLLAEGSAETTHADLNASNLVSTRQRLKCADGAVAFRLPPLCIAVLEN